MSKKVQSWSSIKNVFRNYFLRKPFKMERPSKIVEKKKFYRIEAEICSSVIGVPSPSNVRLG
jgi:hypothetical protein